MRLRYAVFMSVVAVFFSATSLTSVALAADPPPLERDFFGTVVSVEDGFILVRTDEGIVEVPVSDATRVQSRVDPEGGLADLAAGDSIALSLTDDDTGLVADQILVIPGKTSIRHVAGVVIAVSDTEIIVRPDGVAGAISLARTPDNDVQFHGGATALTSGATVILVATRSLQTGDLLFDDAQIHVTKAVEAVADSGEQPPVAAGDANVRGSFQDLDGEGRWIIDGVPVTVNPATTFVSAVVVGQPLSIETTLTADGALVARHVDTAGSANEASDRTILRGEFQGVDDDGRWIVSGTPVEVDANSDTDGLPPAGEQVKVSAVLTEDGALRAREIENRPTGAGPTDTSAELDGTFQGVTPDGKWIVSGAAIAINAQTQLSGSPSVDQRIKVGADVDDDGSLIARNVEGPQPQATARGTKVEISGTVDEVQDGALIVNGVSVGLSPLTDIEGAPKRGDFVAVQAVLTSAGAVRASEVKSPGPAGPTERPESNSVEIEGTVEQVNEDGSFTVNGIHVATSPLSNVGNRLEVGAQVKIDGVATLDGSVLAAEIKTKGAHPKGDVAEVEVSGRVEVVSRGASGRVSAIRVAGLSVSIDDLTEIDTPLVPGVEVTITAILQDGAIVARRTEGRDNGPGPALESAIKIRGPVQHVERNSEGVVVEVTIDGVDVAVDQGNDLEGIEIGQPIQLEGRVQQGDVIADKIGPDEPPEDSERREFKLEGLVDVVVRDEDGSIVGLIIDGQSISTDLLSRVSGLLLPGSQVTVEGVISDGEFVAADVIGQSVDEDDAPGQSGNAPGQSDDDDDGPGQSGNAPGQSVDEDDAPGQSDDEDDDEDEPGESGDTPGQSDDEDDDAPGQSGDAPGQSDDKDERGQSVDTLPWQPEEDEDAPGQSGGAPGQADNDNNGPGNNADKSKDKSGTSATTPSESDDDTSSQSGNDDAPSQSGDEGAPRQSSNDGDGPGQSGGPPGQSDDKPGKKTKV